MGIETETPENSGNAIYQKNAEDLLFCIFL